MTRRILLIASVAAVALSAPALAEKGGRNGDQPKAERGGGEAKDAERQQNQRAERPQRAERQAERQEVQRAERPQRIERQQQRAERSQRAEHEQIQRPQRIEREQRRAERQQIQRAERPQRIDRQQQRAERQAQRNERLQRIERQPERIERQQQRAERRAERPERQQQRVERRAERPERQRVERQAQRVERQDQGIERQAQRFERQAERAERGAPVRSFQFERPQQQRFDSRFASSSFASREMRPMAPFSARVDDSRTFDIGERIGSTAYLAPVPTFFASNYVDTSDYFHRYDDDYGYVYRVSRDDGIVRGLMPLFGGYGIGDPWPQTYYSSYVPLGYRDYYYDTSDYYYRNDGYGIYQVDSTTQLISALVALVMGQGFGVGQTLPQSYGAYNVPLQYRANYADSDDNWYRYGDGFIYQVDPGDRRIAARYPIHADDYFVGDPWPVAYPDYNVPYGYQSLYADTPQDHYRFANGGIYQVDPTSQVIRALVALVTGNQFGIGQQLPVGYDTYNVPFDYRDRYADSDDEYFRYANGHVYRVDADSRLIEEAYQVYG